jgi:hypothetical protein
VQVKDGQQDQPPQLERLADGLDRFLLALVLVVAAVGVALPGLGRRADAGNAVLVTLAVLVFSATRHQVAYQTVGHAMQVLARARPGHHPAGTRDIFAAAVRSSHNDRGSGPAANTAQRAGELSYPGLADIIRGAADAPAHASDY